MHTTIQSKWFAIASLSRGHYSSTRGVSQARTLCPNLKVQIYCRVLFWAEKLDWMPAEQGHSRPLIGFTAFCHSRALSPGGAAATGSVSLRQQQLLL
jgi:hypothetical protein